MRALQSHGALLQSQGILHLRCGLTCETCLAGHRLTTWAVSFVLWAVFDTQRHTSRIRAKISSHFQSATKHDAAKQICCLTTDHHAVAGHNVWCHLAQLVSSEHKVTWPSALTIHHAFSSGVASVLLFTSQLNAPPEKLAL